MIIISYNNTFTFYENGFDFLFIELNKYKIYDNFFK